MHVEEVDCLSAPTGVLVELAKVELEADAELLAAGEPPTTLEVKLGRYRNPSNAIRRHWLARAGVEPVGLAKLEEHGPTYFYGTVKVRPAYRRGGIGAALYERVLGAARERGAPSFFGHHTTDAGAAFARSVGAVDGQRDVKSVLRLREAQLPEPAAPVGIELRSWVGPIPDAIVESFVRAGRAMDDAPTPSGSEFPSMSVETLRESERSLAARGVAQFVTVAIEDGEVLAFTAIRVFPEPSPCAATDDTGTVHTARGRGLAQLVKLENLRYVRRERADVELVRTYNAEDNAAIRAVNEKLGFVPTVTLTVAVVTP